MIGQQRKTPSKPRPGARAYGRTSSVSPILYGRGETVLLLESNRTLRKLGKTLLEKLNYHALTASRSDEILSVCRTTRIDLLIVDATLPGRCGQSLLAGVRELRPAVRCLYSSVFENLQDLECCQSEAADSVVLLKPYTVRSFSQAIKQGLLGGAREESATAGL